MRKFHKDWIKLTQAMLRTKSDIGFFGTQGQVTPKRIVLVRDCIRFPVIYNFHKDPIKTKQDMVNARSNKFFFLH